MADELTIKVSAKLDEGSVSAIQSQLDSIGKNKKDGIKLQIDKTITTQINTLKKSLDQMSNKIYPIKIQIDQTAISNIQNLTESLNKAVANVQNSVSRQTTNVNSSLLKNGYTGVSRVIQRGKWDEINGFEATSEIEKRNLALGETLTIYKELKKEQDEEFGRLEETSRQYETNYELQAKEAAKAYDQQIKEEAKYRSYIEKENEKTQREQETIIKKQQQEQARIQKGRDQKSSMYAGMFQQIEKEEQKERDRITKEEQKRQDDYTKLHIQARQKQAKEDERLAKEEQKRQNDYDKLFAEAERRRIQQEADAKKASEQSYLSDLKKNSKQLEFEQKTSANAQSLITNAQNELSLLEKSTFSGSKALTGDYAERARAEIAKVSAEFDKLKEAAGKSFSDAMGVSKDGLTASLKNLGAELDKLKGLQYPADKLAAKDVDTLKLDYGNKIQEFRDQLKEAGLESSEFTTKLNTLDQSLQTVGAVDGSGTVWADWKAQFESLQASYEKFQASASGKGLKLAESIDAGQLEQVKQLSETLNFLPESVSGSGVAMLKDELSGLSLGYQDLIAQLQSGNLTNDEFTELSNKAKELDDRLKQVASSAKIFQDGFKNEQALEKYSLNVENLKNRFDRLKQKYDEFVEANPSKANSNLESMFERVGESINNIDPTNISTVSAEVRNLGTAVNNVVSPAQSLSQILTQNLGGVGQYLARFTSAFYIINKSIQTIKSMVNEVTELDTSLMELQKVTNLSGDSLSQFTDNAYKTGKEVGRTGKDVIDAVTTFSRAGYNLEESNELAKAALTMTNVGVDIPNTEAAASDMISILRAYDKQANESMQVIDELYNVANKEPLDFGNITDMLVTAGGTLAQTNTSLEESMGLLTGAFATMRDTSVANGLIMISQRLRGVKEDGEAIEEEGFMPKLQKAFGDVGVSIQDQNGELRSTFDILQDLAGVWDTLSSKQKQYLGEKAAGNRQVKTLNAVMANWDIVEDTIRNAEEATGAATEGNEKYLDSIQGRITQFKSAFSDLSRTVVDSDLVKFFVGAGTEFLTGITGFVRSFNSALAPLGKLLSSFFKTIGNLSSNNYFKSMSSDLSTAKENAKAQKDTVEDLNSQLKDTQTRIDELNSKETLTIVEQSELKNLQEVNKELQTTIELEKARASIKETEERLAASETLKALEKKGAESFSDQYDFDGMNKAMEKAGNEWIKDLNKQMSELPKMYTIDGMFGAGNIVDNSTLFKQTANAYNSIDYLQEQYKQVSKAYVEADTESEREILDARKKYLSEHIKENLAIMNRYSEELHNELDGLNYIENPDENDIASININKGKDLAKLLDQKIITAQINDIDSASNYVISEYSEQIDQIKKKIEQDGKIEYDQLISDFPEVVAAFERYGGEFGLVAERIATHLNEMFSEGESGKEKESLSTIKELMTGNYLASDSYKTLSTAMTEQQKAGTISMETYQKLIESDEKLANALTLTADGYALNSDAVNEYIKTKTDEQKTQALLAYDEQVQKLAELKKRYEELSNATIKTDDVINELAQNQTAQEAAERDMEAIAAYVRELDAATGALARFKAAQSSVNEDANFQDSKKVYEVLKEGNKTGKRNTDDFKSAADYVLGDNWRENLEQFGGSVEKAYQHAEKVAKRYSGQKDEKTAARNFMKDVGDTGLATYDSKTGSLKINEGVTLDDIATKMGIAKEYATDMFKLLNTYANEGEGFTFPELFTDDEKKKAEEKKQQLKEIEKAQEDTANKIEDVNKRIETASESGDEKEAQRLEQQKQRLEESQAVLGKEHANIESGVEMEVDTMSLEDAKKKIDELYQTISTLNGAGINIPVTIADEYNTLLSTFPELRGELQNPLPPIVVKTNGDALPKLVLVDGVVKKLEGEHFVDVTVDDDGSANDVKTEVEDIESDTYSAYIDTELGTDSATSEIQTIENGPYDSTINVQQAGADAAGVAIDEAAKDRTTTITVKYSTENDNVGELREDQIGENGLVNPVTFTPEQLQKWGASAPGREGTIPMISAQPIEVQVEASEDSGENIINEVQSQIDQQSPVEMESEPASQEKTWGEAFLEAWNAGASSTPETSPIPEMGVVHDELIEVTTTATNPNEPIQQVQDAANANPVEVPTKSSSDTTFGQDDISKISSHVGDLTGAARQTGGAAKEVAELTNAYIALADAQKQAASVDINNSGAVESASSAISEAATNFQTAYSNLQSKLSESGTTVEVDADTSDALNKVQAIADNGVTIDVDGNTSSLASAISAYDNRTVTVNIRTNEIGGKAKGTKSADPGPSLVDEEGAELIEHTRRGTYELGTNNGPRITNLEAGDVVHTASETKRILSRMAKVGGFFRDGFNKAKAVIGNSFKTGISGSISGLGTDNSSQTKKKTSTKKSSSKKSSKKSGGGKANMEKLQKWFEKLFDWAEVRLDRLQRATNNWIANAAEAIGYAAQNKELASAMASVEDQINATNAAYDLYIAQADKVAKKTKLSADIIQRIQNGTIDISEYGKNTQEKIKQYQLWLNISCHFE